MMWQCKDCTYRTQRRLELLKHYKLNHGHYSRHNPLPCLYSDCPCTFKTTIALHTHMSRYHVSERSSKQRTRELKIFKCQVCEQNDLVTEKGFLEHVHQHLKNHEMVSCYFEGCTFQSNVYGTFRCHKSRKHPSHTAENFKSCLVTNSRHTSQTAQDLQETDLLSENDIEDCSINETPDWEPVQGQENAVLNSFASLLVKLESVLHVSTLAIDELVSELEYLLSSVSATTSTTLETVFDKHNMKVDQNILKEIAECTNHMNPIGSAIARDGPLGSAYKRRQYFSTVFKVVEPVEYVLNANQNHSYQYIPILKSLQQLLDSSKVLDLAMNTCEKNQDSGLLKYRTYRDGSFFKNNNFLSAATFRISIGLYVDDFEICNPLGTSKKKHKVCAVYWVLSNVDQKFRSSLTSINLALLCKSVHVKEYGYNKILEPLLSDLMALENQGVFVSKLGKAVQGTVHCVAADNLGAHSLGGFVESFSGHYICRFCTGKRCEFQMKEVRSGAFKLRTKEEHFKHLQTVQEDPSLNNCCGVKKSCPLTERLQYFHVLTGYPPDALHDLLEGIVPVEVALCLSKLISKKYVTLKYVNESVKQFPLKWSDKADRPQPINQNFSTSIGGNAHENWTLLRMLPFFIGSKIPKDEPVWEILLDLKDIVELVMASSHTEETVSYLDFKISHHRQQFQLLFPDVMMIPKYHFLEHYPTLIRCFGPLVALWTMRFEAKHSFFKQVARYTNCFRNILLTLATKHQLMMAYHFNSTSILKPALEVTQVSTLPIDLVKDELKSAIKEKHANIDNVHLTQRASFYGTGYAVGMILTVGSTGGLPDFVEIVQILIEQNYLYFIAKKWKSWYIEHLRSYELTSCKTKLVLVEHNELADYYPLAAYMVHGKRMVTLKRYVST